MVNMLLEDKGLGEKFETLLKFVFDESNTISLHRKKIQEVEANFNDFRIFFYYNCLLTLFIYTCDKITHIAYKKPQ